MCYTHSLGHLVVDADGVNLTVELNSQRGVVRFAARVDGTTLRVQDLSGPGYEHGDARGLGFGTLVVNAALEFWTNHGAATVTDVRGSVYPHGADTSEERVKRQRFVESFGIEVASPTASFHATIANLTQRQRYARGTVIVPLPWSQFQKCDCDQSIRGGHQSVLR